MKNYLLLVVALLSAHLTLAQNDRHSKAEVFIQIENRGNFTISLDNETISSAKGRFRFYDVSTVEPILSISQGNRKIYSQKLVIRPDERLVLTYNLQLGLKIKTSLKIYRNGQYALDDFDSYTDAYNTGIVPPRTDNYNSSYTFETLHALVKKAPFDDAKMDLILIGVKKNQLSTVQLITLLKLMNDDDKKLGIAKSVYHVIADPQNFYSLEAAFSLLGRKNDFINYLKIKPASKPNTQIQNAFFEQLNEQVKRESFDDGRTLVIQNTLKDRYITTTQMKALLKFYKFEDSKLIAAKLLYHQIIDKQQYYTVSEVFTFNSSKDVFLDFITNMQTKA